MRNLPDIEMNIENIPIPYNPLGKGLVVPPLRIAVQSSANSIKLLLEGESSMIFILYHLKNILHTFLAQLPTKLGECDTFPSQSSNESDSRGNQTLDDVQSNPPSPSTTPPPVSPVVTPPPASPMVAPPPASPSVTPPPNPSLSGGDETAEDEKNEQATKTNEDSADELDNCPECLLVKISRNIISLVNTNEMQVRIQCDSTCLTVKDSMAIFVDGFLKLVVDLKHLKVSTMSVFKKNFYALSKDVLNNAGGSFKFYCSVMGKLIDLDIQRRNRIVRLLNEITEECIRNHALEFEEEILKGRNARRNLTLFLYETGSISSIHAVLQLFHKMHKCGVDIARVLPSFLSGIEDEFHSAPLLQTNRSYHQFINEMSRRFIQNILKEQNISILKTYKKVYIPDGSEFEGDSFIYFDKKENILSHFLAIKDKMSSNCIPLNHLMYDDKENTLESEDWRFFLQSKWKQVEMDMGMEQVFNEVAENASKSKENKMAEDLPKKAQEEPCGLLKEETKNVIIEAEFVIDKDETMRYWNPVSNEDRKFHAHLVGTEWPGRYKGVCCVVLSQNHAKRYKSRKRKDNFAKVVGVCTICKATHTYQIVENPFQEIEGKGGIEYIPKSNMLVDVTVCGKFFLTDGEPDVEKPVHYKDKARGNFCKGRERELMGQRAGQIGPVPTYLEQFAYAKEKEIEFGNRTSIRSLPVIKGAKSEEDKKIRGGSTHYESAKSALDLLANDTESPNFPETNASKQLPGIVRSLQENPFKITYANFDMSKVGGLYMNGVEESIVCIDSSGKNWQDKNKAGKNLLNSALVIPPLAKGLSPFPLFEMVSEENKTLDFVEMTQRAWGHMATAMNNTPVKEPKFGVTDLSFPNLHAFLTVFNRTKLPQYLEGCFDALRKNEDFPFHTVITICESHLIPAILLSARNIVKDKLIADTCVAGLLLVLRAETITRALEIWENLVVVHGSKNVNNEARDFINKISKKDAPVGDDNGQDQVSSFDDDTPSDEAGSYGDRKSMRTKSPFFPLFSRAVIKVQKNNEMIGSVSNDLFAPAFLEHAAKQFLSLFPFISATVLGGNGLMNNAHIELHWKSLRAEMAKIPKSRQWPAVLLGHRHQQTRRQTKEILVHSLIPNTKFGNKTPVKRNKHSNLMEELSGQDPDDNIFRPTSAKKRKRKGKLNESYDGSKEKWGPKVTKSSSTKKDTYMKGKSLDHQFISWLVREKANNVRVTGINDEGILLTKQEVDEIGSNNYISDASVGAGLLLLDKRLNDVSLVNQENINVYSIANCRLILAGELTYRKEGKFITILPKNMNMTDFDQQQNVIKEGRVPTALDSGHYTLVSNLFCNENECNVFETFGPFRNPDNLLKADGKKLLKYLTNRGEHPVKVKCVEVNLQVENECGPLAFGLALQLCFYYHEGGLNRKLIDVREHLLSCLKQNELVDFPHTKDVLDKNVKEKVLFSINI